ncbi:MAG: hypothetical protein H0W99_02920 [Acidobacteria bacterium]|nr:hypothetical protein [Acidobacteriota bacterium]
MSAIPVTYNRGAVNPLECLRGGWNLIKGQYWLFLGITAVGILIGSFGPMAILLGPMMCGIYLCLFARIRGERVSFELLFKGFDYFKQSLIATLIQVVPVMVLLLPVYIIFFVLFMNKMNSPRGRRRGAPVDPSELYPLFIVMFVVILGVVVIASLIGALFIFSYPLIVDRRLAALDAVRTSIKAVMANPGGVLGLLAINMLLGFAGMLLCYVGAFFVMPVGLASWAVAYRQVFPAQT